MTLTSSSAAASAQATPIEDLIHQHGAWRVLRAALAALVLPAPRGSGPPAVPDHLRRDIGLPPLPDAPAHWSRHV